MQILFLILLSAILSSAAVSGTELCLEKKRGRKASLFLFAAGIVLCLAASVLTECILKAGRPSFYYHTHPLGRTTVKLFGIACLCGSLFHALLLMLFERKHLRKTVLVRLVLSSLLGICGAILLEVGFFNFRHFELIGAKAPEVSFPATNIQSFGLYFNRASWKFHPYSWKPDHRFTVYTGNRKIRNISIPFDDGTSRTPVRIGFSDSTHRNYEYLPVHELIEGIPRSYVIPIHTVGRTYSIGISLPDTADRQTIPNYGISLPQVTINSPVPLEIDPVRFTLCFLAIFLTALFFPDSPVWMLPLDFRSLPQMLAVSGLLLFFILWFACTVFSSYAGSDSSFSELKSGLNENYRQYSKLVDALLVPRYSLPDVPDRYLEQLDDVYDMKQREGKKIDYLWDTAYFEGKYYVYFGVVPAVTVLLPYRLLTGADLELDYPILGFSVLFLIGLYGVYAKLVRKYFPGISFGLYWIGLLLLVTPLNITWCLRRTLVYELAIVSGICFAVWGIFFILPGKDGLQVSPFRYLLSGAFTALAVGCRPTMLFVSIVVFTAAACGLRRSGKILSRRNLTAVCFFLIPYLAVGMALMKYNYERFHDPFEFGITYQLTTENRAAGLPLLGPYGRLLSILSDLFTFPAVDMNFPFIHLQKPSLPYNGVILDSDKILGVFSYPVMGFLFLFPFYRRRLAMHGGFPGLFIGSCLTAAFGICFVSTAYAVANRYLTDYLYLAALPAVMLFFVFYEHCEEKNWSVIARAAALICGIAGTALFSAVSLTGEGDWFRMINPLYFDRLRYALSPWL